MDFLEAFLIKKEYGTRLPATIAREWSSRRSAYRELLDKNTRELEDYRKETELNSPLARQDLRTIGK
jgi:hypothetical protein